MKNPKYPFLLISSILLSLRTTLLAAPVITEIHYGPDDKTTLTEFIEIHNPDGVSVDISGWRISGNIDATFPANTILPANGYILVAENPTNLQSAFTNIPGTVVVLPMTGLLSNQGETVRLRDNVDLLIDEVSYKSEFPWPIGPDSNGPSMELISPSLDNDLGGSWRSSNGTPTPGLVNSVNSSTVPPIMRQVSHTPLQPTSSDSILVKIKATDVDGIDSLSLSYQIVTPGNYIPAFTPLAHSTLLSSPDAPLPANPDFEDPANWTAIPMTVSATEPDFYEATIPAQTHRTLVRYRITATDNNAASVRIPYSDDPSLNFATYVYNGVPDYVASTTSSHPDGAGKVYPASLLTQFPVYQLITRSEDLQRCYAYSAAGNGGFQISKGHPARGTFNWECAFVYDGIVYDHVQYRLRQNNNRFAANGKRSMRFRFNDGHNFQARDEAGKKWPEKWSKLNTGKMSSFSSATTWGLREIANSKFWRMIGIECPFFYHIHFRVVDDVDEVPAGSNGQYTGDFFGLAMAFEDIDGALLDSRKLDDGNIYKWKDGESNPLELQRNQERYSVTNGSDFSNYKSTLNSSRSESELDNMVDWEQWSLYHTFCEAVRHHDFGTASSHQKNQSWYFVPTQGSTYGKLRLIPHDHDASWSRGYHDGISVGIGRDYPWKAIFGQIPLSQSNSNPSQFNVTDLKPDKTRIYRNVMRNFRDLLWQEDTVYPLLDDLVATIEEFSYADRDRWTNGPAESGTETRMDPPADTISTMKSFAFASELIDAQNIAGGRAAFLDFRSTDSNIPQKPTLTYTGPASFTPGELVFESNAFSDPQGAGTFSAIEWRIAEVNPTSTQITTTLFTTGATWKYHDLGQDLGTAWKETSYDDSTWASGPSELGYGESETTTVSFGGNPSNKQPTTYFRKTFTFTPDPTKTYTAKLLRDDGAAVYLNGNEIHRSLLATNATYGTFASGNAPENVFLDISINNADLVDGANVFAVEIHQREADSSDISFDFILEETPAAPAIVERYFEWDSVWESGLINSFSSTITPPASATRTGQTYRARVRHHDNSGRSSNWSDPVEFTAGTVDTSLYTNNLVISEFLFNPSDVTTDESTAGYSRSDFEYIEILNIGSSPLDLANVRFTKGIDFDFASTTLAAGARIRLSKNPAAYALRYTNPVTVVGPWTGKLKDEGEQLKLSYGAGLPIRDFIYGIVNPWPTSSGIVDFAYALKAPSTNPDHSLGQNWRPYLGNPLSSFSGSPQADTDGDGIPALVEHALGTSDLVSDSQTITYASSTGIVSYKQSTSANDIQVTLEISSNLSEWDPIDPSNLSNHLNSSGEWLLTYDLSGSPAQKRFYRLKVTQIPAL